MVFVHCPIQTLKKEGYRITRSRINLASLNSENHILGKISNKSIVNISRSES